MPYRILFFGTSDFAIPSLRSLIQDARFEILGVITKPDQPVGRHAVLTPPAIKQWLIEQRSTIPLQQPTKLTDPEFQDWLTKIGPRCDAFVVVSYGKIFPQWLLNLPRAGVVNVHGSVLPRWRGASPIHAAICAGDAESGITIMNIDAEMDHGPILATAIDPILPTDTTGSLHDRLADLGGKTLPNALAGYLDGSIRPIEQDHDRATSCKILSREDGQLDFTKPAIVLERFIRGMSPWPGAWMNWDGKRLKIHKASIGSTTDQAPGSITAIDHHTILACADHTALILESLQPEGKPTMSERDFSNGHLPTHPPAD